jgi:hypothetical protein
MDSGDSVAMNYNQNQLPLTVGIIIFDQVEVLDVAGRFVVFLVTRLDEQRRQEDYHNHPSEYSCCQKS